MHPIPRRVAVQSGCRLGAPVRRPGRAPPGHCWVPCPPRRGQQARVNAPLHGAIAALAGLTGAGRYQPHPVNFC
jgi:hypothetical protein